MNDSTTFKPGDRVRHRDFQRMAFICADDMGPIPSLSLRAHPEHHMDATLHLNTRSLRLAPRMSQPARTLLAAWHASDRTLHKLNETTTGGGRIRHRWYTTDDGIVTLRITTGGES